jgi:two-component system response regulator HydG
LPRPDTRILVVDDEEQILHLLSDFLQQEGFKVETLSSGHRAIEWVEKNRFDILILDLKMPEIDGLEVLRRIRAIDENLSVIIMTGYGTMETAVHAMKLGADDYLLKPLELSVLNLAIIRTLRQRELLMESTLLRERVASLGSSHGILARSKPMIDIMALAAKIAPLRSTVLIQGESGTGKELLARAIHAGSPRADRPFVAFNCGVIPLSLLESELFGHERGAFTGAETRKIGYFEAAEGGTVFLDEVSETSLDFQVKLLRVLQERVFRRVGGTEEIPTDVRIIVSTNRDLEEEVRLGRFRRDLYYRLNVIILRVPPLRHRPDDISLLARHFLGKYAGEFGKKVTGISTAAMEKLLSHSWPGNVRELENTIERAVAVAEDEEIGVQDMMTFSASAEEKGFDPSLPLPRYVVAREGFERSYLSALLGAAQGNVTEAARIAGLARQNLYQKMNKLGIVNEGKKDGESEVSVNER